MSDEKIRPGARVGQRIEGFEAASEDLAATYSDGGVEVLRVIVTSDGACKLAVRFETDQVIELSAVAISAALSNAVGPDRAMDIIRRSIYGS